MENGYQKKTGMRRWVKQTWRVLGVAACMGLHARERDNGNERMVFLMGGEDERVVRKRFEEWRVRREMGNRGRRERKGGGVQGHGKGDKKMGLDERWMDDE